MDIQSTGFLSIEQLADQVLKKSAEAPRKEADGVSFQEILRQKTSEAGEADAIRFSKHASARLSDRKIDLEPEQLRRLQQGTQKASAKGIRDSLVIVDDLAFIVNVPSRTVVTAMDSTETADNVFTNINGAVIM